MKLVLPGVWARGGIDELCGRLARADLFISDFDECMIPVITQAEAAARVFRRIASSPAAPGHFPLFVNMAYYAGVMIYKKKYMKLTGDSRNSRLIIAYEKFARGAPVEYFRAAAAEMKGRFYDGAADVIKLLKTRGAAVGVVSLGLDIIIGELLADLEARDGARPDFTDCTVVEADERGRFMRYAPGRAYLTNEDKRGLVRARAEEFGAAMPVVVGHDRDDLMMLDEARRLGGVAVGFRPESETLPLLDAAVDAGDWRPLETLLAAAFGATR